jgi:nucleoside-diphosphate-sugar epimerase
MILSNDKKILVTGGTGHLGSALIHHLVNNLKVPSKNIRTFYLANSPTNGVQDIEGLDMFPGNILHSEEIKRACEGIQLVFHLIGSTTFDPLQKRLQWNINVEGTTNILEVYRQSKTIEKIMYTSTVNTLGVPNPIGSIGDFETSDPYTNNPRLHSFKSPEETLKFVEIAHKNTIPHWEKKIGIGYFDSKLAAQEVVNQAVKEYGLNIISILPGTMFGPYDYLIGAGQYLISIYRGQMPGVIKGCGMPLAHVMDVVEGQVLAMEKASKGTRYIISGLKEDNRYLMDMMSIIVEVLQQAFPEKQINGPTKTFSPKIASIGAFFMEKYASIFKKPCLLSRDAIKAGSLPLFYSYGKAAKDLGYQPKRTFKEGVTEMCEYYKQNNRFEVKGRYLDLKKK